MKLAHTPDNYAQIARWLIHDWDIPEMREYIIRDRIEEYNDLPDRFDEDVSLIEDDIIFTLNETGYQLELDV